MSIIAYQQELRPVLDTVFGAKEYREFRETLIEMDKILEKTGIERRLLIQKIRDIHPNLSAKRQQSQYRRFKHGLRYSILLGITGLSLRTLSLRVADSHMFQWFTYTDSIGPIRPLSKSDIERSEKCFTDEEITQLIHELNRSVADKEGAEKLLYRETALRMDEVFADTTCIEANIHFPVDWLLFRDATRTLINAIMLIRSRGLRNRIRDPKYFISAMNKLCIEMTHARKKKDSQKVRKHVLRRMKKLMKIIEFHAQSYHQLLENSWKETDLSECEAKLVLKRMKNILKQLPAAEKQAHERIIGERRVANKDKILSFYDPDIRVIVRGKAGAEVEFGNTLYLAEQTDGLIIDWDFIKEQAPGDNKLVAPSIERIRKEYGDIESFAADRGFDSLKNTTYLEQQNIINAICPRSVSELKKSLTDKTFCHLQKRRGATEARIGIFKNDYLGKPLNSKGFENRKIRIQWCVLSHNLWKLSTMAAQRLKEIEEELLKTA